MRVEFSVENNKIKEILTRLNNMKYVFAGNYLEYTGFVEKQEENGFMEISKVEHLNKIKEGGTLIVTGNYKKRAVWPEIEKKAIIKGVVINEQ
jgi:hypothetical protein